jgi:hypothetical protein
MGTGRIQTDGSLGKKLANIHFYKKVGHGGMHLSFQLFKKCKRITVHAGPGKNSGNLFEK